MSWWQKWRQKWQTLVVWKERFKTSCFKKTSIPAATFFCPNSFRLGANCISPNMRNFYPETCSEPVLFCSTRLYQKWIDMDGSTGFHFCVGSSAQSFACGASAPSVVSCWETTLLAVCIAFSRWRKNVAGRKFEDILKLEEDRWFGTCIWHG